VLDVLVIRDAEQWFISRKTSPLSTRKANKAQKFSFLRLIQMLSSLVHCLWNEILSQQRIRHFKILQSIYFAYGVGIISSAKCMKYK